MISLEKMDPTSVKHAERYLALLGRASTNDDVIQYLPEIFDEKTIDDVRASLSVVTRYLIVVAGVDVGRTELTDHINTDPSVISKVPAGVSLGYNTCYFVNPGELDRGIDEAHLEVAKISIEEAFTTQVDKEASPWLPVAPANDPSRGWLLQNASSFTVHITEPQKGWFPQFGIEEESFHFAYAIAN